MSWFDQGDIHFRPSLSEGLPVVGVQALAMGLAIVASRAGGFVDLVEEGRNGYLFPSDDGNSMAEALRSLLTDPEALQRVRQNSREMARRFDIIRIADAYEKLYEELLHPSPAADECRRILILNSEYPPVGGGAGNASANLARWLTSLGFTVTVITSRFGDLPHREKQGNLTLMRIPAWKSRQDRSHASELIFFILSACVWTLRLVARRKAFKPDATLAFFGVPSGAVAYVLKVVHKIPYVISLRGGDVPGFRPYDFGTYHKIISPVLRIIWKNASAIVANSNGLRALALHFDSRFEIPVIPNGVDLDCYETGEHSGLSSPHLLSVGRIVHQKGIDLAMHALAGLKDLDWEWRIAGDGPQMESLKRLAAELDLGGRLQFLGWQSRDQLVEQYQWSDLFLFPSRHEGMPNAVLEAMASGLPVIATRISGSEELVVDGETGLLVPSEDVRALQSALRRLLTDPALRRNMGLASRRRAEGHYSWENAARQYALLLEQVQ
jgi:glycosyltransferase involved in cell wall biosynthesis